MIRRLALAGLLALFPALASAQFATIGPTPLTSDNGDRLATTAWVNNFAAGSIPLLSGKIFIGSASNLAVGQTPSGDCTLSLSGVVTCTQAAGNFNVIGSLTVGGVLIDANGELMTNIVAPATPAAGLTRIYVDSTTKILTFKNDAGLVGNAVVPAAAGANTFATGIAANGVITYSPIAANSVTRAMEAQGIARSVVGVTGNATANVGDIQGTANQALVVNSAGTALAFGQVNLAAGTGVTGTLPVANGGTGQTSAPSKPTASVVTTTSHSGGFAANGSGTYTTPANVTWIEITIIGGGGGGGGGNNATPGTTGSNSCWNTAGAACTTPVYQAGGGTGGVNNGAPTAGGTIAGSGTCDWSVGGSSGTAGSNTGNFATTPAVQFPGAGGIGGDSTIGGGGGNGIGLSAGSAAATNSGAGGGGGGTGSLATNGSAAGSGGGSGATCHVVINTPAATYTYVAGGGGAAASAGTTGAAGGNGAGGQIIVYEHYGS
jgi:hypothetical protein